MTDQKYRLRVCMLYDFKQGKAAAESHRSLRNAFGEDVISERQCRRWFDRFHNGDESLEDEEHQWQRQAVDSDALKEAVESDPCHTTHALAQVLAPGQTVTAEYAQQLTCVDQELRRQGVDIRTTKFLHDNARPHVARIVQQKIEELGWEVLPHPPYSPDLAPSDYHLFRSMQHSLKENKFQNFDEMRLWLSNFFDSQPPEFFERGIRSLRKRWKKVIDKEGEYITD